MSNVCFIIEKEDFNGVGTTITYRDKCKRLPFTTPYKTIFDFRCQCGCKASVFHLNDAKRNFKCPLCDSEDVVYLDKHYKTKMFNATYKLVEKEVKDFKLTSTKYKAIFREDEVVIKEIGVDTIEFKDGYMKVTDYRGVEYKQMSSGFGGDIITFMRRRNMKSSDIIKAVSGEDENELKYYNFMLRRFKEKSGRGYYGSNFESLPFALYYEYRNPFVEKFYKAGYREELIESIKNKNVTIDYNESKIHKMLGVPKASLRLIKHLQSMYYHDKKTINNFFVTVGGNNFNILMNIVEAETVVSRVNLTSLIDLVQELYNLGYTNIESLANYICRRTKLEQGLSQPTTSATYLRDYVRIMKELGYEYEKYPKSLKKVHDIAVMNKEALKSNSNKEKFENVIKEEDYLELEMRDKMFSIIAPKSSDDLIKEGESLSHCVASYVNDVADKICKVLFLRFTNEPEDSYMTIELRGKEVRQFKGVSNRRASSLDLEFLNKWVEKKGLVLRNANAL